MNKNNGGPAFPIPLNPGEIYQSHAECDGMTLRDYFAVHASEKDVSAIISTHFEAWVDAGEEGAFIPLSRQQARYMHADAMLKEREK